MFTGRHFEPSIVNLRKLRGPSVETLTLSDEPGCFGPDNKGALIISKYNQVVVQLFTIAICSEHVRAESIIGQPIARTEK